MPRQPLSFLLLAAVLAAALAAPAYADVEYKPEIKLQGLKDKKLSATLEAASQLVQLKDKPPASNAALRRRTEDDLPRLKDVMQASGYWMPTLTYTLDTGADEKKAKVTVTIDPGPLYHLATVTFRTPAGETPPLLQKLGSGGVGLEIGGPAASAPVAAANQRITDEYARNGRPFAKVVDRKAVIDVATHTMAVTYTVDPGAEARFGPFAIEGLNRVNGDFAARRVAWKRGAPYDSRAVEKTRQDLVKTGLFSAVRISHADAPDAQGEVPMTIDLVEGPPRSIGAGVAYNTNLGLGAQAFWQHRNLFGAGENLRVTAGVAQKQLGLALAFRKPDFVGDQNQDFLTNAALLKQSTDAFDSFREQVFVGLERPLLPSLTTDFGLSLEHARVTRSVLGNEDYTLFGAPFYIRHDTTDDLLDPTIGGRQTLTLIPYHSLAGPDLNFLSSRIEERHYQRLDSTGQVVLAGFAALGSIVGATRDELPADKRLYAGGAGSVRGYAFQRAGPLGPGDVPLGGASSLELGVELRYRITDSIGVAPFVEGGNVYDSNFPNSTNLLFGGGIGFRYYTVIGPVRLDLATPFQRRPGDGVVQFYISIGQAF